MSVLLVIATLLGGIAAVWYFHEKLTARFWPRMRSLCTAPHWQRVRYGTHYIVWDGPLTSLTMRVGIASCSVALFCLATPAPGGALAPIVVQPDTLLAQQKQLWEFSALTTRKIDDGSAKAILLGTSSDGGAKSGTAVIYFANLADLSLGAPLISSFADLFHRPAKNALPDPVSGLLTNDFVENDNVMARLPNGHLIIARGLQRQAPQRSGTIIWDSGDEGKTWRALAYIDPTDPHFEGGVYGLPQDANGFNGGWDREELYADPWTGHLFLTFNGTGGVGTAKKSFGLLFRSDDGGVHWQLVRHTSNGSHGPVMMTSFPHVIFFFQCFGGRPVLWWSRDDGQTFLPGPNGATVHWSGGVPAAKKGSDDCGALSLDGSTTLSRVSQYPQSKSGLTSVVRVTYPELVRTNVGQRQILHVFTVSIAPNDAVQIENGTTIEEQANVGGGQNASVFQATVIEPDMADAAALRGVPVFIYWRKTVSTPNPDEDQISIRGVVARGKHEFSEVLDLSTDPTHALRSWNGARKPGDYAKGGFYVDPVNKQWRFFVPWIEGTTGKGMSIHAAVIGVPQE